MTSRIAKFFGLEKESNRVQYLAKVAAAWMPLAALAFTLSSTFYSIYVAEILAFGDWTLGFALVGILAAISMGTQLLLDYPTGGIGDWIGQRWILAASYACFGLVFYLTALGNIFPFFWYWVIIYIITAVGAALNSGALMAWFDNNYRSSAKDPERKAYSKAQGRMGMFFQIAATAVLIPGAIMALLLSREGVFIFQAILCMVLAGGSLILFRDSPEVIENRPKRSIRNYFKILKDGLEFSFSTRLVLFFLIGTVIMSSTIVVWGNMLLFLIYYSYLGNSDVAVAIFRTILFAFGVLWIERAGVWTRNLSPPKWIPRSRLLQTCGPLFYFAFAAIIFFMPPLNVPFPFNYLQISTLLICAGFILSGIFNGFGNILNSRLMLDLVPDKIRNGIYSLIPTLTLIFAVPQTLFLAPVLVLYGIPTVLFGLGIVSLAGLLILFLGLRQAPKKPILEEDDLLSIEEPPTGPTPSEMP